MIKEKINAGLITDYSHEDLEVAYIIYKEIIECDIKARMVNFETLKMARDPETSLENIVERKEALDTEQMNAKGEEDEEALESKL